MFSLLKRFWETKKYTLLFLSLLLNAAIVYFAFWIRFDNSIWLPDHNIHKQKKDYLYTEFQRGESLLIAVPLGADFFQPRFISLFSKITEELEKEEGVVEVKNPLTAVTIIPHNNVMEILSFKKALERKIIPDIPSYKRRFTESEYFGRLLSKDYKRIAILIKIEAPLKGYNYERRKKIIQTARRILDAHIGDSLKKASPQKEIKETGERHLTGAVRLNYALAEYSQEDVLIFMPLVIFLLFFLLYFIFHRILEVIIIIYIALSVLGLSFTVFVLRGYNMTAISISLPILIVVIAIADAIHIFNRWYGISSSDSIDSSDSNKSSLKKAAAQTIRETWLPCFLTSATTAIGFGSFYFSEVIPLSQFGELSFIVILLSYVLIMLHMRLFLSLFGNRLKRNKAELHLRLRDFLVSTYTSFTCSARHWILGAVLLLTGLAFYSFTLIRTETNFLDVFFKKSSSVYQDFDYVDKHLGGTGTVDILLNARSPDGKSGEPDEKSEDSNKQSGDPDKNSGDFNNIKALEEIHLLEKKLSEYDAVNYIRSYLNPIRMIHKEFAADWKDKKSALPRNDKQLAQELLFLEFSRGDQETDVLSPSTDFDYTNARIHLQTPNLNSSAAEKIKSYIEENEVIPESAKDYFITGESIYFQALGEYVIDTQLSSIAITVLAIWIIFCIHFRFKLATIGLFANLLPVLLTISAIAYLDIPFDFATVVISSISFCLCVDDTIHFIHFYYIEKKRRIQSDDQIKNVIRMIGLPIFFTSVLFSCGFIVFVFSNLVILIKFGIFTLVSLIFAFTANVIILPALLRLFDKQKQA